MSVILLLPHITMIKTTDRPRRVHQQCAALAAAKGSPGRGNQTHHCGRASVHAVLLQKLLTTSARASAAAEQYWQQHASSTASSGMGGSSSSIGSFDGAQLAQQHRKAPGKELQAFQDGLPGGEKELAQRTREACEPFGVARLQDVLHDVRVSVLHMCAGMVLAQDYWSP